MRERRVVLEHHADGITENDARAALSYEQSEQRAAASRAKMYHKADELVDRVAPPKPLQQTK